MIQARPSCLLLLMQLMATARPLALLNAGSSMAARMAMMAMTTSNSIKVKARLCRLLHFIIFEAAGVYWTGNLSFLRLDPGSFGGPSRRMVIVYFFFKWKNCEAPATGQLVAMTPSVPLLSFQAPLFSADRFCNTTPGRPHHVTGSLPPAGAPAER